MKMLEITTKLESAMNFLGDHKTDAFDLAPMYLGSYRGHTEGCVSQVDQLYNKLKETGIFTEENSACLNLQMDRRDRDGNGLIFTAVDGTHSNHLSVWLQNLGMACNLDYGIISIFLNEDFFEGRGHGSFKALLDQLLPCKNRFLLLLFVPEKHLEGTGERLKGLTFFECMECTNPTEHEYLKMASDVLNSYGLVLNKNNSALLLEIIKRESGNITENAIINSMREIAWRYATKEGSVASLLKNGVVEKHIHHKKEEHKVQLGFSLKKEEVENEPCEYYVV